MTSSRRSCSMSRSMSGRSARSRGRKRSYRRPMRSGSIAARQALRRVAIARLAEPEQAARGDLAGPGDRGGLVGEQPREAMRRAQVVLVVAADPAAGGDQGDAVADAGQDVLQRAARAGVI